MPPLKGFVAFELDIGVEFELDAEFNGSFLFIGLILCLLCRHYVVFYAALHSCMIFLQNSACRDSVGYLSHLMNSSVVMVFQPMYF